jgi:thiosulfate dehydrogenase [quinone] large subunit
VDERERVLVTLAAMRALMGVIWLSHLIWKLPPSFGRHRGSGLMSSFTFAEQYAVIGPLRDLVRDEVIPHFTLFGYIVFAVEATAGILLLIGLFTRVGAAFGLAQAIVISLFVGGAPHEWRFGLVLFIAWHVVLLATPCARRLSLDDRLGRDP